MVEIVGSLFGIGICETHFVGFMGVECWVLPLLVLSYWWTDLPFQTGDDSWENNVEETNKVPWHDILFLIWWLHINS